MSNISTGLLFWTFGTIFLLGFQSFIIYRLIKQNHQLIDQLRVISELQKRNLATARTLITLAEEPLAQKSAEERKEGVIFTLGG